MEHINLELVPRGIERTAHASQYDHGRQIRFDIYNGGTPYTLSGAETITMQVNGQSEAVPNTSDDYIIWTVPDELCETDGVTECELRIVESGVLIGSKNFFLEVEYDPYGTGVIILSAHGSPAHFETDLSDNAVECKVDIAYNANGYKSALLVNTSNAPSEDETPYLFRPSFANGYGYETLIGGTCGVNQLATGFVTQTLDDLTITNNNDGSITVNGTASANGDMTITGNIYFLSTHKYLVKGYKKVGSNNGSLSISGVGIDSGNGNIWNNDISDINLSLRFAYSSGDTFNNVVMYPQIIDLTAYFGTTIADYVYTLESGTSGAGITWLKNNGFFGADYYPYNAGGLLSVKTSKKINVGFNAWDEVWENGQYDSSGLPSPNNNVIRSKNYIPVVSGETYYFKSDGNWIYVCQYDSNKNFIGSREGFGGGLKTLLSNCCYVRFNLSGSYGNTYLNNICINLHSDLDGQYQPYISHEYPLDDIELRGILKLDGNNNLYYDGDTYESNGSVTRKYASIDLGSINWLRATSSGTVNYFYIQNSELPSLNIKEESFPTSLNLVCPIYTTKSNNNSIASALNTDMTMCRNQTNICIRNDTYSTPEAFKTAMNGKYLVYELASPTTETAQPFTNPMIVDGNGTEEFVDTRAVQMPVGHSTIYGEDMKARNTDFGVE